MRELETIMSKDLPFPKHLKKQIRLPTGYSLALESIVLEWMFARRSIIVRDDELRRKQQINRRQYKH